MTNSSDERGESEGITDDQLPEDLQPQDNPLAEGLEPGERAGDLLEEGRRPEQSEVAEEQSPNDDED